MCQTRLSGSVVRLSTLTSYAWETSSILTDTYSLYHISLSKQTLLWPRNTCMNSEEPLPPIYMWNHIVLTFFIERFHICSGGNHRLLTFLIKRLWQFWVNIWYSMCTISQTFPWNATFFCLNLIYSNFQHVLLPASSITRHGSCTNRQSKLVAYFWYF